jgi:pilus assembly protein CpaE
MDALAVVLIVPNNLRRVALAKALAGPQANIVQEFTEYPSPSGLSDVIGRKCDVVIVDLDADAEQALNLVESICSTNPFVTVMISSSRNDSDLLIECMRAGARELLTEPLHPSTVAEALVRAYSRVQEVRRQKVVSGKVLVFTGAKGGSGVTTLASNFALALAKEESGKVVLVDLDLQLGDAALTLGMTSKFSILDALRNEQRLDSDFLSTLLTIHPSGLEVLAAPDVYSSFATLQDSTTKVLRLLRNDFAHVVIDAGSNFGSLHESLFEIADTIYLVTQVSIPALRNANRLLTYFSSLNGQRKVEIVLNRYDSRQNEIDEQSIAKALTQPANWKIPNDYSSVRRAQNTGVPVVMDDTPITRQLQDMARAACGKPAGPAKKKRFSLFG